MKLTAKQDINAPLSFVKAQIEDFESWERAAMRRGADVSRTDKLPAPGKGMAWTARFRYRAKDRNIGIELVHIDHDGHYGFRATSAQADADMSMELVEMAAKRSRAFLTVEILPKSFTAKLFVQSLKLARGRMDRLITQRAAAFGAEIEDRYARVG